MKCNSLEELIIYIEKKIMQYDYERCIRMSFGQTQILLFVFEQEIPIKIDLQKVYTNDKPEYKVCAEVYAELLTCDIGCGWLSELDEICTLIEDNAHIFEVMLKKGE